MGETILEALEAKRGFVLEHEREGSALEASASLARYALFSEKPLRTEQQAELLGHLVEDEARLVAHLFSDPRRLAEAMGDEHANAARLFQSSAQHYDNGDRDGSRRAYADAMAAVHVSGRNPVRGWIRSDRALLSREQPEVLARYRATEAKLVETNARLIEYVIRRYTPVGRGDPLALLQGAQGLRRAVEMFLFDTGATLATYSMRWIRAKVARGVFFRGSLRWTTTWRRNLAKRSRGEPLDVHFVDSYPQLAAPARNAWFWPGTTLPRAASELFDPTQLSPARRAAREALRRLLRALLAELPPREREVLKRRYGLDEPKVETLEAIGEDFGISRERVRQLQRRGLNWLGELAGIATIHELLGRPPADGTDPAAPSSEGEAND